MPEPVRTLINGRSTEQVAVHDRGLTYGDGVFRTLSIRGGRPRWWADQYAKLSQDCARLGLACPGEAVWLTDLAQLELPQTGVMRLTVTRGEGPRGYSLPAQVTPTRIIGVWATDDGEPALESVNTRVCQLRLGHQPALAGVKHLNRLENVLARAEWSETAIREGLLLDQSGQVVSGVMSNLFLWQAGRLRTPRLDQCGVAGVARARLMRAARQAGLTVEETRLDLADVHGAEEIMFTNSLILMWRVARLEDRVWETPVVSPELRDLLNA